MHECQSCVHFFTADPPVANDPRGECQRYPRVPVITSKDTTVWNYPMMNPGDGCGEYKKG